MSKKEIYCYELKKWLLLALLDPVGQTMSLGRDISPLPDSFNEVSSFPDKLSPYGGKMQDSGQNLCFSSFQFQIEHEKKK